MRDRRPPHAALASRIITVAIFVAMSPISSRAQDGTPAAGPFEIIFSGGIFGLLIILLLLALSLSAAYLIFEQILTLRRTELMPEDLQHRIREHISKGEIQQVDALCRNEPNVLSFVVQHGLSEVDGGWTAIEKGIEDALAEQSARLLRKIEYLSVIGNIAPMIGLLGTVTGMIFAFQQVASTQGAAGAGELAEGIYQALVTTVGGLIVAIPSLAAFAVFRNRVDQLVAELAYLVQGMFRPLKKHFLTRKPPKS